MAEKYLGEQGLAKLIELVKANSRSSSIYIKKREASVLSAEASIPIHKMFTYAIDVSTPIGGQNVMFNLYRTDNESYTTHSQVVSFSQNGLWITEVFAFANTSSTINIYGMLYYIGPDENAINSGDFLIHNPRILVVYGQ